MNQINFDLIPFDPNNCDRLKISGNLAITNQRLNIQYCLQGNLSQVVIPKINSLPSRQYCLWEHTCFEFFLKSQTTTEYWEFNLAPNQNWNVFHLSNYRENLTEETKIDTLPFEVSKQIEALKINLELDLNKIVSWDLGLNIAIASVIETKDSGLSYWSLTHPEPEADFHHPDSFIINI